MMWYFVAGGIFCVLTELFAWLVMDKKWGVTFPGAYWIIGVIGGLVWGLSALMI